MIRTYCLVRVRSELVRRPRVCLREARMCCRSTLGAILYKGSVQWLAYTWPTITFAVRLHPPYVLTASLVPFGKDFAPAFQPVSGAAAYPKKNEGWVCRERKLLLSADVRSLPIELGTKWKMFSHRGLEWRPVCSCRCVSENVLSLCARISK
jgi:hypothetical protein